MTKPGPRKRSGLSVREYVAHRAELGLLGATKSAVQKALKAGRIRYIGGDPRKGIDPETADRDWENNTNPSHRHEQAATAARESLATRINTGRPGDPPPGFPDYATSRARREHFEAELRRLDLGERLGHLLQAETVAHQVHAMTSNVRQRLLTFPPRVSPMLASVAAEHHGDPARVAVQLELLLVDEVRRVLEVLESDPTGAKALAEAEARAKAQEAAE